MKLMTIIDHDRQTPAAAIGEDILVFANATILPDAAEDEEDMLDLAFGLTKTSQLGCQIIMTEELDGLVVRLPGGSNNAMK